ncbi:MAG: DUF2007 domain-containing protein [Muribaculaceae bacterium]|nr:DUF2007 domain-containing protein [Muribaculaceae bacterium]MBR0023697.1 DUF2007 domain-containing protein [Muribaculaceae bacterium]
MVKEDEVVVFAMYDDPVEANIVKGVLESNGVVAGVMGDAFANTVMKGFSQGTMRVVVFRKDLERAHEIMDSASVDDQEIQNSQD